MQDIKILATLGPSSMKESIVQKMDSSGVDIFRINLSHTKLENLKEIIEKISSWTKKPICIDTEGAQIRTGEIRDNKVKIKNNTIMQLTSGDIFGDQSIIPLYPIIPYKVLQVGDIIAIDFHSVVVQVIKIEKEEVSARVLSEGEISSNKGVNVDRQISLPAFTEKDLKAFEICKNMGLTYFSFSFAAYKKDIETLRSFFFYPIFAISKIESRLGLTNLEDICKASDALLIDRGDLSREVVFEKIALAQKHIIDLAKNLNKPVYVATNLLDSMIDAFEPNRAEVNDITNILLSGAQGLVLAAETAIGKYPVQTVRMVSGIKREVENYISFGSQDYLKSIYEYNLIEPHGGVLVQNFIENNELDNFKDLIKINVDDRILSDIIQIAEGTYSPLRGFMNKEELMSVLEHYKMPNGVIWTMPILFQLDQKDINFDKKDTIVIKNEKDKDFYAIMKVADIEKIDLLDVAKKWFGTDDPKHPGAARFAKQGDYIISGEVFLLHKPVSCLDSYTLTPRQTRQIFKNRHWQKIVGFHTRNIIHRGHEFIQKQALKLVEAEALFINPVVGQKKANDFSPKAIFESYEQMLKNNYYEPYPALIASFNTYSRYSGPREAVFTALCRKNFGCSHFVVGRDHTGVGDYYPSDASQRIFEKIGDIGIEPIFFDEAYFCKACNQVTTGCNHNQEERLKISGSEVRKHLLNNSEMPDYLLRKDISELLNNIPKDQLFEQG
jgi:pyruvate kinase